MGQLTTYEGGQEVPSVRKQIAQDRITLFEISGGYVTPTIPTDPEASKKPTGLDSPMASGRMSLSFATECLRRFFGNEVYNRSGMVDLRFVRPVRDGDYKPSPTENIIERAASDFSAEATAGLLDRMLLKGSIGWKEKGGVGHWFLLPFVIGMYEGQDGNPSPEFLADSDAYMKRTLSFGRSFVSVKPSQMRTIPISRSITAEHHVATYDQVRSIVRDAPGPFVVLPCICRKKKAMKDKPCARTSREETCLALATWLPWSSAAGTAAK